MLRGHPAEGFAMKRLAAAMAAACVAMAALVPAAHADDAYPNRTVKLIVPFTPGTGIDILARTLGQKLSEEWKVAVVVENRPGASGAIGTEAVAKSPADGYTLLMQASTIAIDPSLHKKAPYDPVKDFAPVAPLALGSLGLVVHPSVKAESVKDLVALARSEPGRLTYASPGSGTPHHLAMELFKQRVGIDVLHVPYKGTGGAVQDLLGGQVNMMFLPIHVALSQVKAGKLRLLAAGGTRRAAVTPDTPSLAKAAGVADIDVDIWYAMYAPAGTPPAIVAKLNADVNRLLKSADVASTLASQGLTPTGGSAEQLGELTRNDLERWAKVVHEAKITAD
jgi:tripartite-type tricarboxylate transporter receptor subunit TctC